MIVKKPKRTSFKKSKAVMVGGLVDYTPQEVANEVFRHAPTHPVGQNRDERMEYGRRAVWYAFGTAGDIDIANIDPTPEQIQKFIQEAEQRTPKDFPTERHQSLRMR